MLIGGVDDLLPVPDLCGFTVQTRAVTLGTDLNVTPGLILAIAN